MKHLAYTLVLFLLFTACNGFLEEDDRSLITPDEFFMEDRDAQSAIDAIYSHLDGSSFYAKYYWLINALASDIGETSSNDPDLQEFSTFTISPTNSIIESIWSELYAGIKTANFAIENVPRAPISEGEKEALVTEARFFRGMFYFDLIRFFGDVPLVLSASTSADEDFSVSQTPKDSILSFLVEEFSAVSEILPAADANGRPDKIAALAFLTKVFVLQKAYPKAFQVSRMVLGGGSLLTDYASVFKIAQNNSQEAIFSITFNSANPGPMNNELLPPTLSGKALGVPTDQLVNSFDVQDRRRTVSLLTEGSETYMSKYWDQAAEPNAGNTANDLVLIRFSDVLFTHAEIINEVRRGTNNEALAQINAVRKRARFDGKEELAILPDLGPMNYDNFKAALLLERQRELAFEGYRWFDLVRAEQLEEKVLAVKPNAAVSSKHYLFPIPQVEIDRNPLLKQNTGY